MYYFNKYERRHLQEYMDRFKYWQRPLYSFVIFGLFSLINVFDAIDPVG